MKEKAQGLPFGKPIDTDSGYKTAWLMGFLIVAMVVAILWWAEYRASKVVDRVSMGSLDHVTFESTFFSERTLVKTAQGDFLVAGAFQASKGAELVIERRADGKRWLCAPQFIVCNRLHD